MRTADELTADDVRNIRLVYGLGHPAGQIAGMYGITAQTAIQIIERRARADVPDHEIQDTKRLEDMSDEVIVEDAIRRLHRRLGVLCRRMSEIADNDPMPPRLIHEIDLVTRALTRLRFGEE